jgi:hypothetical protein
MTLSYTGSGPYCYANSLAMMLGDSAPTPALLEVLTGSPFGMQLLSGRLPMFDPYGWDPDLGIDAALEALGWSCDRTAGGDEATALDLLCKAVADGPVMVGPVELGLLRHQPGAGGAIGADHWVVVLEADRSTVLMHDPQGHPYATMPTPEFMRAWRAEQMPWVDPPFVMRTRFSKTREVEADDAIRAVLPQAARWLSNDYDGPVPEGTLGGAAAVERLAAMTEAGLPEEVRVVLVHFAVRVGARRLNDAATVLDSVGATAAAAVAAAQARIVGGLQYHLVNGADREAATGLRALAPTYAALADAIRMECRPPRERPSA